MKFVAAMIATVFAFMATPSVAQNAVCEAVDGAAIISDDDEYIGRITDKYAADSIYNSYGKYGGKYSALSIFNQYGKNGGKYSHGSPFNPYSSSPPRLVKGGKVIAVLSINKNLTGALNPTLLGVVCYEFEPEG